MIETNLLVYIAASMMIGAVIMTLMVCHSDDTEDIKPYFFEMYGCTVILWPLIILFVIFHAIRSKIVGRYEKKAFEKPFRGEVLVPEALIALFDDHDIPLTDDEASLILEYLNDHDYTLYVRSDGQIMRHDLDADDGTPDDTYSIEELVYFVFDMNDDLINIHRNDTDGDTLGRLRTNETVFAEIIQRYLVTQGNTSNPT